MEALSLGQGHREQAGPFLRVLEPLLLPSLQEAEEDRLRLASEELPVAYRDVEELLVGLPQALLVSEVVALGRVMGRTLLGGAEAVWAAREEMELEQVRLGEQLEDVEQRMTFRFVESSEAATSFLVRRQRDIFWERCEKEAELEMSLSPSRQI